MKVKDYLKWALKIPQLNIIQREDCAAQLKLASGEVQNIPLAIAQAVPECCPHCKHGKFWRSGMASGLQRWLCLDCDRTFNALTGTPLARLRKKEKWLDNAKSMIAGESVRKTAAKCGVHYNTIFRWRHCFLLNQQQAQCKNLSGIAESDETYFYRSRKGEKNLEREPRKRGGDRVGPGLSKELVPVVSLRDRSGYGADRVAPEHLGNHARELYQHLKRDTLLITDGSTELCAAAKSRGESAHLALPGKESRGLEGSPYHLQTVNGFHARLKNWMRRFHGVATKYLSNYVGWHRHLAERTHQDDPNLFIKLSFRPLSVTPKLTMI
jgi:transposase-like protein